MLSTVLDPWVNHWYQSYDNRYFQNFWTNIQALEHLSENSPTSCDSVSIPSKGEVSIEVSITLNVLHEGPSCNTLLFSVGPFCHTRENILFQVLKIQVSIASGRPQCQEKLRASQLLFVSGNFLPIGHPTVNYIAKPRRGVRWALNIFIDFLAELDLPQTEIVTWEIESCWS